MFRCGGKWLSGARAYEERFFAPVQRFPEADSFTPIKKANEPAGVAAARRRRFALDRLRIATIH